MKKQVQYKQCSHCKKMKPITEYYKSNHSSSKDGYRFECKQCDKEIAAKSLRCKKAKQDNKYKKMHPTY